MIPDSFVIGGRRWRVEKTTKRKMPKDTWGDTNYEEGLVRVRTDLSEHNMMATYYHELFHVFLFSDGKLDNHDEEYVDRMGSYLKQYEESKG